MVCRPRTSFRACVRSGLNPVLLQRILTALALLAPVLAVIFFASSGVVFAVFGIAGLLMAWEWASLMGLQRVGQRWSYLILTLFSMGLVWAARSQASWIFTLALIWWCIALGLLPGFPANFERRKPGRVLMGIVGQLLIAPTILALAVLHMKGPRVLFFALVLVWAADIGAYFAGRAVGKHKLASHISPGKTVEGVIGGLILSVIWALAVGPHVFAATNDRLLPLMMLSLVAVIFSIVGDLTESLFKRLAGIKDSGAILPGHGGLLDRVDSLLAAMPIFALGLTWAGW